MGEEENRWTTPENIKECHHCEHYLKRTDLTNRRVGECRRFPPMHIIGKKVVGLFPLVSETTWCSEFSKWTPP